MLRLFLPWFLNFSTNRILRCAVVNVIAGVETTVR